MASRRQLREGMVCEPLKAVLKIVLRIESPVIDYLFFGTVCESFQALQPMVWMRHLGSIHAKTSVTTQLVRLKVKG